MCLAGAHFLQMDKAQRQIGHVRLFQRTLAPSPEILLLFVVGRNGSWCTIAFRLIWRTIIYMLEEKEIYSSQNHILLPTSLKQPRIASYTLNEYMDGWLNFLHQCKYVMLKPVCKHTVCQLTINYYCYMPVTKKRRAQRRF